MRFAFAGTRRKLLGATAALICEAATGRMFPVLAAIAAGGDATIIRLRGDAGGRRFDGIGVVNGGGATSVLLKDYPEPQRSQILDLLYKPQFGASVSALLVEIPGDGNATQGSMPSHMHARDDLNHHRGYTWWVMKEAKRRNPALSLDGTAWSAPGWIGTRGTLYPRQLEQGDVRFFSNDAINYYIKWLEGARRVHGLEMGAVGVRNEKGVSYGFAKAFRHALTDHGFANVKLHGFDNWPDWKLNFVADMRTDHELRDAIDVISAHTFSAIEAPPAVRAAADAMGKPIWNTEDHVYLKSFDCAIGIVECFNRNFIRSGATKVVNWYDIAALYPVEPYPEDPAAIVAHEPWSGHYRVREALWGYAHYGQFTAIGWTYLNGGSGELPGGGSYVTLGAPSRGDYSIIVETRGAKAAQTLHLDVGGGLSTSALCVWCSTADAQFVRQADLRLVGGKAALVVEPGAIYSLSTIRGQRKGGFGATPASARFPFPYSEGFARYTAPEDWGYLPRYTADIAGAFEIATRPDGRGACLRQVVPVPTISWAPDWQPYTILGDAGWTNYEVAADVWLNPGDTAGVMGRINHVGTGYGFIPKGYFLELSDTGACRLVVIRGKRDPKAVVGDAEQQAIIRRSADASEGGERVLGSATLPGIAPGRWHRLALRFEGSTITGLVDGRAVLVATDSLYASGMAGLLAGQTKARVSTPWYAALTIGAPGARVPADAGPPAPVPIYSRRD